MKSLMPQIELNKGQDFTASDLAGETKQPLTSSDKNWKCFSSNFTAEG